MWSKPMLLKIILMRGLDFSFFFLYFCVCYLNCTREWQISDSRMTEVANFPHPLATIAGLKINAGHRTLSGVKFNTSSVIWSSNGRPVRHKILVSF